MIVRRCTNSLPCFDVAVFRVKLLSHVGLTVLFANRQRGVDVARSYCRCLVLGWPKGRVANGLTYGGRTNGLDMNVVTGEPGVSS